jgi:protein-glutamine gamma-glutamyltransferase
MRFGLVHRIMTDALAALGVLALVSSGQFSRSYSIFVTVTLFCCVMLREDWRQRAGKRHVDTVATVLLIGIQLARSLNPQSSALDLLIEFAVGLQIIRVATRRGAAHDQQVIVLALLHLIAGTVVGGGLGYGLCFFGLLIVTPGALVLSHLRREVEGNYRQGARDRTGLPVDVPRILRSKRVVGRQFIATTCLLSLPILLFTGILFIVFPRVGLSLLLLNRPKSGRMIGFSGKVDLGQIGTLRSDPTIVLRVNPPRLPSPPPRRLMMHLRGTALDHYDGRSWTQSTTARRIVGQGGEMVILGQMPRRRKDSTWRMELEPIDPPVLFFPPATAGFTVRRSGTFGPHGGVRILRGSEGELRYQRGDERGVTYTAYTQTNPKKKKRKLRQLSRLRYVQIPDRLPRRVEELAKKWTQGASNNRSKAVAIERQLRSQYRYDLSSPSGAEKQPLDHFLFESRRGHCEYFSTAMAVMLRTLNVPTRNVTGFVGGTYNRYGKFYAVRQGDAHSWVEVFEPTRGWTTYDPTPPGAAQPQSDIDGWLASARDFFEAVTQRWNRHVVGYDLRQQVSLLERLRRPSSGNAWLKRPSRRQRILLLGIGLLLFSLYWLRRSRRSANSGKDGPSKKQRRSAAAATQLYEALDQAMRAAGMGRAACTPPKLHARQLREEGHPFGEEVSQLTTRYLEARFGQRVLSSQDQRDFSERVHRIRADGPAQQAARQRDAA